MPYSMFASGHPEWSFDSNEMEKQAAIAANSLGITSEAAWVAFISGLTVANLGAMLAICKAVGLSMKSDLP